MAEGRLRDGGKQVWDLSKGLGMVEGMFRDGRGMVEGRLRDGRR